MKRKILLTSLFLVIILAGCAKKQEKIIDEGAYLYSNKDLGFNLVLGSEFEYYQTQRTETGDFIDIQIFVPTSDTEYYQEVQSYAIPLTVRIFNKDYFEASENEKNLYVKVGETKEKVYAIRFWEKIPKDWKEKWTDEVRDKLVDNFKLI